MWFPLLVLAVVILGSVVETLVSPAPVMTTGPGEDFGWAAHVEHGVSVRMLSAAEYSSLTFGASDEYWWCAAAVCWFVLLAWYRGGRRWWQVTAVGFVVPVVFGLGLALLFLGATEHGIGLTVPGLLVGLAALAGAWARWGQGRGRWLGVAVCAALSASTAVAGLSAVAPAGGVVMLVAGAVLAWFARSPLATVAAAVAGLVLAWSSDPVLPGVVAAVVLLVAAAASRHPRLRHV